MKKYRVKHIIFSNHYPFWMPLNFAIWLKKVLFFVLLLLCFLLLFCLPLKKIVSDDPILHTGDVQVTVRWNTIDDVDLHVIDPYAEEIYYSHKESRSGGMLDVDANASSDKMMRNPVENIYWPSGQAPMGKYVVSVVLYRKRTNESVPYTVTVKYGEKIEEYSGEISIESSRNDICTINYYN